LVFKEQELWYYINVMHHLPSILSASVFRLSQPAGAPFKEIASLNGENKSYFYVLGFLENYYKY